MALGPERDQAIVMLADYLTALRREHPLAVSMDPPIRLEKILEELSLAELSVLVCGQAVRRDCGFG
jgi:hypothetical protein